MRSNPTPTARGRHATRWTRCAWVLLAGAGAVAAPAAAQVAFSEVGAGRGIGPYVMAEGPTGGVVAADYDDDGDIDLFVPNGLGVPDQLYRNLGDGHFEEIAAAVGLDLTSNHRGALWFDADGDGDLDLVVSGDCRLEPLQSSAPCPNPANVRLFRQNDDGTFTNATFQSGLNVMWGGRMNQHRGGLAAGDIDGDGYLDLYITTWNGRSWLFRNDGDGTFTDVTVASGIGADERQHFQPLFHDFNGDGAQDIYVSVDGIDPNSLWLNQGDGTFVDVAAAAGVDNAMTDMGIAPGDYDDDGDIDLYVTNIHQVFLGAQHHNVFYRNDSSDGTLAFTEIATDLGIEDTSWGWGATFLDCNNDGHLDLAVTNGNYKPGYDEDQSRFFLNVAGSPPAFADVSDTVGFNDTWIAAALIAIDADRDGDLDLVQTTQGGPLRLIDNEPGRAARANHWLVVRPRMDGPNRFAIGAIVRATSGDVTRTRLITAGMSTLGQEPAEAFFGLGDATTVETLRVEWPDGSVAMLTDVPVDRVITVPECPTDLALSGATDPGDLTALFAQWGPCGGAPCAADLDGSGQVGFTDLFEVLRRWGPCAFE